MNWHYNSFCRQNFNYFINEWSEWVMCLLHNLHWNERKKTLKTATKIELKQTKIHLQMHSYLICRLHEFLIICWKLKLIRIPRAYSIHCKIIRNIPGQKFAKKINFNSNRNVCSFYFPALTNKTIQTDSNVLSWKKAR